jgi:hypothetical protein
VVRIIGGRSKYEKSPVTTGGVAVNAFESAARVVAGIVYSNKHVYDQDHRRMMYTKGLLELFPFFKEEHGADFPKFIEKVVAVFETNPLVITTEGKKRSLVWLESCVPVPKEDVRPKGDTGYYFTFSSETMKMLHNEWFIMN